MMNKNIRKKIIDLIALILILTVPSLAFQKLLIDPIFAAVFWLILPSAYILYRLRKFYKEILTFSLRVGTLIFIAFYFANVFGLWNVPSKLPRLGTETIEEAIFAFLWPIMIVGVDYLFFNKTKPQGQKLLSKKLLIILAVFLIGLPFWNQIEIPYAYFVFMILTVATILVGMRGRFFTMKEWVGITVTFFILHLIWEIVSLKLGLWEFNGQYIGFLNMFDVSIPIEEFVAWIILGAPLIMVFWNRHIKGVIG